MYNMHKTIQYSFNFFPLSYIFQVKVCLVWQKFDWPKTEFYPDPVARDNEASTIVENMDCMICLLGVSSAALCPVNTGRRPRPLYPGQM